MSEPISAARSGFRIRDLPCEDRPRERLLRVGAAALTSEELLAERGGLVGLAGTSVAELSRERGIKKARAAVIEAALELGRRLSTEALAPRDLFHEPGLVKEYLRKTRGDGAQERTGALFVNARNRLLKDDPDIYRGTLDRAVVEPREILKRALLANAAGVILYHNHPSGDPSPSREDREFTRRLAAASESVGVRLLDHIVVGRSGCVSFREAGLL